MPFILSNRAIVGPSLLRGLWALAVNTVFAIVNMVESAGEGYDPTGSTTAIRVPNSQCQYATLHKARQEPQQKETVRARVKRGIHLCNFIDWGRVRSMEIGGRSDSEIFRIGQMLHT